MNVVVLGLELILGAVVTVVCVYGARQYVFTLNRLFGRQRHPFIDVRTADWPAVTVLIPAHNEAAVIAQTLSALLQADYPPDRLTIVPIDDASTDDSGSIIDEFGERYPGRIIPVHRPDGGKGKAAALLDATSRTSSDILVVFDADYTPSTGLLKRLVAPFFDPEVGAVMGRVVPENAGRNLLTRLLDLERAGGYQVDQQARMNLSLVPQYGGTVGGVRRSALHDVGGWRVDTLTEDTDLTIRLVMSGWQIVYENRAECYEEVPETWGARYRQIERWARGHNEVLRRFGLALARASSLPLARRIDGLLLLGVFLLAPLMLLGWAVTLMLFYVGQVAALPAAAVLAAATYATMGNVAAFFEIAAAARLDGIHHRVRLLPFLAVGFFVSLVVVSVAALPRFARWRVTEPPKWNKTPRFRGSFASGADAPEAIV
jgi:cellulose synthase/poly-beta-1,6-N-acetylglucosamine synthase-like glycosyltransferase